MSRASDGERWGPEASGGSSGKNGVINMKGKSLATGPGCEIILAYWHLYSEAEESLNTQPGEKMFWIYLCKCGLFSGPLKITFSLPISHSMFLFNWKVKGKKIFN